MWTDTTVILGIQRASEILKRTIKTGTHAEYVLPLIFLKQISCARNESGRPGSNQFEKLRIKLNHSSAANERITDFSDLYRSRNAPDLGARINETLRQFERQYEDELTDVFHLSDYTSRRLGEPKQRDILLRELLECLNPATYQTNWSSSETDLKNDVFDASLEALCRSGRSGIRLTPQWITRLVAQLVTPEADDSVIDPTCGSGGMLLSVLTDRTDAGHNKLQLCGYEKEWSSWAAARMNFFLKGENAAAIKLGTPLDPAESHDKCRRTEKFDVVISHFPWGTKGGPVIEETWPELFWPEPPPLKLNGDYSFIVHMLSFMKPNVGRMVALVPNAALTRGGAERNIRKRLVNENLIDAVISLPNKVLFETPAPLTLLLLRFSKRSRDVLFVSANELAIQDSSYSPTHGLLDGIVNVYRKREQVRKCAYLASLNEISANNFDLNVVSYIASSDRAEEIDFITLRKRQAQVRDELNLLDSVIQEWLTGVND